MTNSPIAYASPAARIGKTDWRLIIRPGFGGDLANVYQWRDRWGAWRDERDWPTYDHNNGQTAGLPAALRKLWIRETDALVRFGMPYDHATANALEQRDLF